MVVKATKVCFTFYYRSKVYCSYCSWKRDAEDEVISLRTGFKTERLHNTLR